MMSEWPSQASTRAPHRRSCRTLVAGGSATFTLWRDADWQRSALRVFMVVVGVRSLTPSAFSPTGGTANVAVWLR